MRQASDCHACAHGVESVIVTCYHLIVNPVAGKGRARRLLPQVEARLLLYGASLCVYETDAPGDAKRFANALPEDAAVLVLGGDGTLHEVVSGCVGTERTLGLIPGGSGDDFAATLGLRTWQHALAVIRAGKTRLVDTASVENLAGDGERYVAINACGLGLDADVAARIRRSPSWLTGVAAYAYAALRSLLALSLKTVTVQVDGAVVYEGPSLLVAAQNGRRVGGGFVLTPDADPGDGVLDVVIAGALTRTEVVAIFPQLLRGTLREHPKVTWLRGTEVDICWGAPERTHIDGEVLEPHRHLSVTLQPASLRVYVP